jgi:nucleotide-binding universal stress UspA family protein
MNAVVIPVLPAIQLKRILYATDFSDGSRAALPIVSAIARKYGSQVYVANVWSPLPYSMVTPEALAILENKQIEDVQQEMATLLRSAELDGLPATVVLESGDPVEELKQIIQKHAIDLAVVGTHGRTGVRRLLMGSLAEELFRSLTCPVLTVGPHIAKRLLTSIEIKNILFPTDLSTESATVFPYLASLAAEYEARMTILHVAPVSKERTEIGKDARDGLRTRLERMFRPKIDPRCDLEIVVESGDPGDRIVARALAGNVDLIGLGVRRAGEVSTHFRNTIAYKVVLAAESPVLTYRGPARW